jgi:hypothetical protein
MATPSLGGERVELTLSSVEESSHARPGHPSFSLIFDSAGAEPREQQIFTLTHSALGELDLFLVPVSVRQYEAVIN